MILVHRNMTGEGLDRKEWKEETAEKTRMKKHALEKEGHKR